MTDDKILAFPQKDEAVDETPIGDSCGTCTAFYPQKDGKLGQCRRRSPSVIPIRYNVRVAGLTMINGRPPDTVMELESIDTFFPVVPSHLHCQEFKKKDTPNAD